MSVSMKVRIENQTGRPARLENFEDLYAEKKLLDRAAKSAGVPSLFSFTHGLTQEMGWGHRALGDPDVDAMTDKERDRFYASLEKTYGRVGEWYAAADGLKTVNAAGGPSCARRRGRLCRADVERSAQGTGEGRQGGSALPAGRRITAAGITADAVDRTGGKLCV